MSDKRISELDAAGGLSGSNIVPLVQGSSTKRTTLQLIADWIVQSALSFTQSGSGSITRDLQGKAREWLSPEDKGAVGDGVTDDSAAFTAAAADGRSIKLTPGRTYLTGPFTLATANQGVLGWGATVKLKAASSSQLCNLNAVGTWIEGGIWDVNSVAQNGILLGKDYCSVEFATLQNCGAAGIYSSNGANYIKICRNHIKDATTYGIYVESTAADAVGNEISENTVDTSATAGASGIYLTGSNSPFTHKQRRWNVSNNIVKGHSSGTVVGITLRAVDGVCHGNQVTGHLLQISADITEKSTFTGNRCTDPASGTSYGMEINGGYNTISGNYMNGQTYCLTSSGQNADYNTVTGNTFVDAASRLVFFAPGSGKTARYLTFSGNNFIYTSTGTNRAGIYLAGDCEFAHISGNNFKGPGSGQSGGRAVFLDTVINDVSVIGNRFSGWERPMALYSAAADAYINITFNANDCAEDMTSAGSWLANEGSATIGSNVVQMWNTTSAGVNNARNFLDKSANRLLEWSDSFNNPNSNISGGVGSIYVVPIANRNPGYWLKENGTGNTGWRGIITNSVSADKGNADATLTPGTSEHTNLWATTLTADRTVTLATSNVQAGARFRIVRTAAGAFNLNVGTGPLKALAASEWCDVEYNGSAWLLTAFGSL